MNKNITVIGITSVWIVASEFFRNEFLLKSIWTAYYASLGMDFVTKPINGLLWSIWSILAAYIIFLLSQNYKKLHVFIISWIGFFLMMWITMFNLQVLPLAILVYAVPLSMLEIFIAQKIISKLTCNHND